MESPITDIDPDIIINVLGTIVLLSLLVERFLSPIFEWRIILEKIKDKGLKEPIAFTVSFMFVYFYNFDALALIFKEENNSTLGYIFTAGIIAGGSKGSIKLFRDHLGWKSVAYKEFEKTKLPDKSK